MSAIFWAALTIFVATIFQLPFLIVLASPWYAVAWVLWRTAIKKLTNKYTRILWLSLPIAIGMTPVYGYHLSMLPAYLAAPSWIHNEDGSISKERSLILAGSFIVTWVITFFVCLWIARLKKRKNARKNIAKLNP